MVETRRKPEDYGRNGHGHMRQNYIETDSEADLTIEEKRKQVESHPVWLEWKNRIHNIPDPKDTQSANFLSQSTRKFYNRLFARKEKNPFVNSLPPLDRKWKEDNVDPDILASFQSLYQDTLKSRHQIRDADKHFGGLIRKMTEDEIRDRLDAWSLVPSEEEKGKSMTLRQSYEAPREADWTGVSSTTSRAQREEQKAAMKKLRKQEEADAARHAARHADRTGKQYTKDTDMTLGTEESRSARTHSAEGSSVDQRKERPRGSEFDSTEVVPRPKHPRKHLPTESSTQDDRESMKNLDRRLRKPAQLKSSDPTDTTDRPKGLRSCLRPTPQQFKTYEPHKETESSEGSFISKSTDAAASSRKLDPRQIDPKRQLDPDESSKYLRKRVKPPSSTERQTVSASSASSEGDDTSSSTSLVPYRRDHNSSQDTLESGSSRGVHKNRKSDTQASTVDRSKPGQSESSDSSASGFTRHDRKRPRDSDSRVEQTDDFKGSDSKKSRLDHSGRSIMGPSDASSNTRSTNHQGKREPGPMPSSSSATSESGSYASPSERTESIQPSASSANPDTQLALREKSQPPPTDDRSRLVKLDASSASPTAENDSQVATRDPAVTDRTGPHNMTLSSMFSAGPDFFPTAGDGDPQDLFSMWSAFDPFAAMSDQFQSLQSVAGPKQTCVSRCDTRTSTTFSGKTVMPSSVVQTFVHASWGEGDETKRPSMGAFGPQNTVMAN